MDHPDLHAVMQKCECSYRAGQGFCINNYIFSFPDTCSIFFICMLGLIVSHISHMIGSTAFIILHSLPQWKRVFLCRFNRGLLNSHWVLFGLTGLQRFSIQYYDWTPYPALTHDTLKLFFLSPNK